jgi:FkbM family methyltransferase
MPVPSRHSNPADEAWRLPDPVDPAAKLGRRVLSLELPRGLERLRSAAKKVVWTVVEARAVRAPFRYAFRELVRPTVAEYQLRSGQGRIVLRHRSGDIAIFHKFYAYGWYDWPTNVIAALKGLGRPVNVVDLGANIGFFDVHTSDELEVGRVVTVEPDPGNGSVLERVRNANRANWQIIRACASNRPHIVSFRSGFENLSRIDNNGDTSIPAIDVFPLVADADLVKMNIEGAEWDILQDPRLADTSCVWIVEYHRIASPEPRITELIQRLFAQAGYVTQVVMNHDQNGLLWAWKNDPADTAPAVGRG